MVSHCTLLTNLKKIFLPRLIIKNEHHLGFVIANAALNKASDINQCGREQL